MGAGSRQQGSVQTESRHLGKDRTPSGSFGDGWLLSWGFLLFGRRIPQIRLHGNDVSNGSLTNAVLDGQGHLRSAFTILTADLLRLFHLQLPAMEAYPAEVGEFHQMGRVDTRRVAARLFHALARLQVLTVFELPDVSVYPYRPSVAVDRDAALVWSLAQVAGQAARNAFLSKRTKIETRCLLVVFLNLQFQLSLGHVFTARRFSDSALLSNTISGGDIQWPDAGELKSRK